MSEPVTSSGSRVLAEPVFPARKVLLHIGFHKTGTTALQSVLASARPHLKELGIAYPGKMDHQSRPALAILERVRWERRGGVRIDPKYWDQLVRAVRRSQRCVVSSEFFSVGEGDVVKRIIEDLGGPDQVHVVATVRSFDRILPSQWQQFVKGGMRHPYEKWLRGILADPPTKTPAFWRQHDHAVIMQRWADVVGPENTTLVVLDESDRSMMFRAFEQMLAVPPGLLVDQPRSRENRSFTAAEAEMVRRVNKDVMSKNVTWSAYTRTIRYGAVHRFLEQRKPGPDEQPILTPQWAIDRAAEIGEKQAAEIRASGINVVGDVDSLANRRVKAGNPKDYPKTMPLQVGVEALLGAFYASTGPEAFTEPGKKAPTVTIKARGGKSGSGPRDVRQMSTRALAGLLARRVRRRLTRRAGRTG